MILKKLTFNNYKTYYGTQEVDLYIPKEVREEKKQNIILLGGLNGAGKTTILKAILYILFGKRGMGNAEYKRLFSNAINNTFFIEGGRNCSLTLSLETDSGEEWTLKLKLYFDNNKSVTLEERNLEVRRPGTSAIKKARIDNIEAYNKFIDRIIPYHAAPFFIFDGEEVKEVILRQNSQEMKEAIHKITGMEAFNQLLKDLQSLKQTLESKLARSVSHTTIKSAEEQLQKKQELVEELTNKKNKYLKELKHYQELINQAKTERNNKLVQNSKSREVIVKKQSSIGTTLEITKKNLSQFLKEHMVNIMLREKIQKLKKRLSDENKVQHQKIIQETSLSPYRNFMNQLLSRSITPALTNDQLEQIKVLGQEIWVKENKIRNEISNDLELIHDVSNKDFAYLTNLSIKDKLQVTDLINMIIRLQQEYNTLETEIRNAPEAVNLDTENEKIDLLTKKYGEIDLRRKSIDSKLHTANEDKKNILNKLTRIAGQDSNLEELQQQLTTVDKTIIAMKQYVEEVTIMKATFIRNEFSRMLKVLFRKQDEFGKIEFDLNTYSIRLYNDKLQEISIQDRSAGEMQMISSALIWALTKASNLSLPMVIDTPLGRLDSYHRNHLINHYYKELSDQVIILSTDTEITQEYVNLMKNHSYKQYMLDYNESKKYTVIRDGYFQFV
ncbi:DNA sulfur modification protein DndD [Cytobacillus gottheilii]|uniref:DNA sulfur modification protein DndD n=1 Tax=Cytobacillus gottheilii TaxID=859144 RepID=UPI003CF7B22F